MMFAAVDRQHQVSLRLRAFLSLSLSLNRGRSRRWRELGWLTLAARMLSIGRASKAILLRHYYVFDKL